MYCIFFLVFLWVMKTISKIYRTEVVNDDIILMIFFTYVRPILQYIIIILYVLFCIYD